MKNRLLKDLDLELALIKRESESFLKTLENYLKTFDSYFTLIEASVFVYEQDTIKKAYYSKNELTKNKMNIDIKPLMDNSDQRFKSFFIEDSNVFAIQIEKDVFLVLKSKNDLEDILFSSEFMSLLERYFSNIKLLCDLYEENQLLNRIIKNIPESFAYKNLNEKYLYSSFQTDKLYTKIDTLAGKTISEIYPGDEVIKVRNLDIEAISSRSSIAREFQIYTDDGFIDVQSVRVPVFDSEQKLEGIISLSHDVTSIKNTEKSLEYNLQFLEILMNISQKFINIEMNEFDSSIKESLKMVGEFMNIDRVYVFSYHFDDNYTENTFEWCNEGIEPQIEELKNVPLSDIDEDWVLPHLNKESVYIEDVSKLPNDSNLYAILAPQEIKSLLTIPMFDNNDCMGFVGFDSVKKIKHLEENDKKLLQILAELIANLHIKKKSIEQADQMAENFRIFFNSVDDFLYVLDEKGTVINTNSVVTDKLGYENDEIIGRSILKLYPKELEYEVKRNIEKMISGAIESCQIPLVDKDGKYISVESKIIQGIWNGKPALFGVSKDITQLKISEDKFKKLFHLNPSANSLVNLDDYKHFEVNQAFCELLGFSENEIIGKNSFELGILNEEMFFQIISSIKNHSNISFNELKLKHKDGNTIYATVKAEKISINNKFYIYTVLNDITKLKTTQQALNKSNEKIRMQAVLANEAKTQFIAEMSHEIRTPLNGIFNLIYLLKNTNLSIEQQRYLETASTSAESLSIIINDILDLSKIEAGKTQSVAEKTDLETETLEIINTQKHLAIEKGLKVNYEFDYRIPRYLEVDRKHLRQILLNLLSNAVKYTNQGCVTLKVCLIDKKEKQHLIDFSVIDTGIGIPKDSIKFLTDKYYRVDKENSKKYAGTGLGLTISNKLVKLLNSKLIIESEPGVGSKFSFSISMENIEDSTVDIYENLEKTNMLIIKDAENESKQLEDMFSSMNINTKIIDATNFLNSHEHLPIYDYVGFNSKKHKFHEFIDIFSLMPSKNFLILNNSDEVSIEERNQANIDFTFIKPFSRRDFFINIIENSKKNTTVISKDLKNKFEDYYILVVDDNRINRMSLSMILQQFGFTTSTAKDGFEAFDLINNNNYDLVLLDVQMPGMDGYELTEKIRKMGGKYKELIILTLTANAFQSEYVKGKAAGVNGTITKPINPDKILHLIKQYLSSGEEKKNNKELNYQIPEDLEVFNTKKFINRFGSLKNLTENLAVAYLEDYQFDIDRIDTAIAQQDFVMIERNAHYYISSCSTLCADRLSWVAEQIKEESKKKNIIPIKILNDLLKEEADIFSKALLKWLN